MDHISIRLCSECHHCGDVYKVRWCSKLGILCEDRKFHCKSFEVKKSPVVVKLRPSVQVSVGSPVKFLTSRRSR